MFFFKKKLRFQLILPLAFLAIVFFSSTCSKVSPPSNPFQLHHDDRLWMEKFLKDVMLGESGIYTLFGSKPMTRFPVFCYSEEDYQQAYNEMSEEDKKNAITLTNYDLPQNWEKWQMFQAKFPSGRYLLIKQLIPDYPKEFVLCFADLVKVALCLERHYSLFQRITHQAFDPLKETLSFKDGSPFWDLVLSNSVLAGILYGYGERNAFCFFWKHATNDTLSPCFLDGLKFHFYNHPSSISHTIANFGLPIFASFSELQDPMIELYKKERTEIQQLYKDKDFVEFTLQKLFSSTSEAPIG